MKPTDRFISDGFSIIAGPSCLQNPLPSWAVDEVVCYPTVDVIAAIVALLEVHCADVESGNIESWSAVWKSTDRSIVFDRIEELDDESGNFGVVALKCDCMVADVIDIWRALHSKFPGLWLYSPESWMLTPEAFLSGDAE